MKPCTDIESITEKKRNLHNTPFLKHIFTDPGRPNQNGYIKSFNSKLRDECLNQNWFAGISEAKKIVESWRQEYNHERHHSALDNLTLDE